MAKTLPLVDSKVYPLDKTLPLCGIGKVYPVVNIKKVGLVVNPKKKGALLASGRIKSWLKRKGLKVMDDLSTPRMDIAGQADLIVVIGGDGTLLNIAKFAQEKGAPILGINMGGLGFLTEVALKEAYSSLEEALKGRCNISERMMLTAEVLRGNEVTGSYVALNDVVVSKGALSRMMTLRLDINKEFVTSYFCDGLIISTSTGSTAHALSSGGPIVHPVLPVIIVVPICPHTLSNRPLVIPGESIVDVKILSESESIEVALTMDGQTGVKLSNDDVVRVRKSKGRVRLITSPHRSYYQVLREKLNWGAGATSKEHRIARLPRGEAGRDGGNYG